MYKSSPSFPTVCAFLLIIITGLAACRREQDSLPEYIIEGTAGEMLEEKLTPYLEEVVKRYGLPGLGVGVVSENEIVYARAIGTSNVETGEPLTIRSLFHLASNSKPFVATAVMQLAEEGRIELDTPLVRYLPYFKLAYGSYQDITVRQMLSHTSGMPDLNEYKWDNPLVHAHALENFVRSIASKAMLAAPGERYNYSSMAYECLGDMVSKVSGMPFEEYIIKKILRPIGMEESTFLMPENLSGNWAMPHAWVTGNMLWDHYPYNRMHGPSSTMHSSVVEMCSWVMVHLNRGILHRKRILEDSAYNQFFKPHQDMGNGNHMGLCWFTGQHRGERAISHSGGDTGFTTNLVMLPERSVAVVVLTNTQPAPVEMITAAALDMLLGYEPEALKSPAAIPVTETYIARGMDPAVALWDSLQTHQPEAYDFGTGHFYGLMHAMKMDLVEEAASLCRLCLAVNPRETIDFFMERATWYRDFHLPNNAAREIIRLMEVHDTPPGSQ